MAEPRQSAMCAAGAPDAAGAPAAHSVLFLTEGRDSPSTRFAVEALVPHLERLGIRCTVSHRRSEKYALPHLPRLDVRAARLAAYALYFYPRSLLGRGADLLRAGRYDAVFLQRDLDENHVTAWLEGLFRRRARRLVFYFDDALWLYRTHLGRSSERKIRAILRMADEVVVSHAYLADYARRHAAAVQVLPLSIDTDRYAPAATGEERTGVTIGWSGGPWNYPDLLELTDTLREVQEQTGAGIVVQSGAPPPEGLRGLGIRYVPWDRERELEGLRAMDVALCPLRDSPWSRGKFSIKLLQYQALGVPVVCSDVGANREIVEDGRTGFLVRSRGEWRDRLLELVRSRDLRERMGQAARRRAVDHFRTELAADRMADLLLGVGGRAPGG